MARDLNMHVNAAIAEFKTGWLMQSARENFALVGRAVIVMVFKDQQFVVVPSGYSGYA